MFRRFGWLVVAAIALLTLPAWPPFAASAQTSVMVHAALHEGFGRVVFDWPTLPKYRTTGNGHRLSVTFDRAFTPSFDGVERVLGNYLSDIRLSDDGHSVDIGLTAAFDYRAFAHDNQVIIDLMDSVSGGADKTQGPPTATNTVGDKPEAPREKIKIRIGDHPNFSRVVFDWPGAVAYQVKTVGNRAVIRFDSPAEIDLSKLNKSPPKHFLSGEIKTDEKSTLVTLVTTPETRIRHFRADLRIVIDALAVPGGTKNTRVEKSTSDAPPPKTVDTPKQNIVEAPALITTAQLENQPPEAPIALIAKEIPTLPPAGDEAPAARPAASAEEPPAVTRVQLILGPPSMTVSVKNETNRTLIAFDGGKPVSAAAFMHVGHLWVIFETLFTIDLSTLRANGKTAHAMVEQRNHLKATVLRFKLRDGFGATMQRRGMQWFLQITRSPEPPETIPLRVTGNGSATQRVRLSLTEVGDHIRVRDPIDHATIDVIPIMASGRGITELHRFAHFDLLAGPQGIAVSGSARTRVLTSPTGVEISTRSDPVSAAAPSETLKNRTRSAKTLFNFDVQRRGDESRFTANRAALYRAVATATDEDLGNARFDLARFFFAHGYMAEAFGILELLVEQEPRWAENISLRAMRGVANLAMSGTAKSAGALSATVFDAYDDVTLWRGVSAMKQKNLNLAAAHFLQAGDLWLELPPPLRDRIGLTAAEALLENGNLSEAKAYLDILHSTSKNDDTRQRAKHLIGRFLLATNDREEAGDIWREVIAGGEHKASARASFDNTLMLLEDKRITLDEAIPRIESLRYAWRSGEFELKMLRQLAVLYIRDGQYRRGLSTMKRALTYFPNHPATAEITARMNTLFAEIFLRDDADYLPAIDALALYFEFRELTPVGAKGDKIIRKLADRLVALDLLERAAELLNHQIKYRLKGVEMARVGTRLAVINLMNENPKDAVRALRRSRLKSMPKDLLVQRRHIRARALADLGREADAMKKLAGDNSRDAELLRADIYWRTDKWMEVAKATKRLLALTNLKQPLSRFASRHLLRFAIALALADDRKGLERINRRYAAVMRGDVNQQAFDMITSDTGSPATSLRELPNVVARIAGFEAFMSSYRERIKKDSLSAIN